MPVLLSDFRAIQPPNRLKQSELNQWSLRRHLSARTMTSPSDDMTPEQYSRIHERYAIRESMISSRSFECGDIHEADFASAQIYPVLAGQPEGVDIGERTQFFAKSAERVFDEFYAGAERNPSHIVHVTCTGYRSPSAAQLLVARKNWGRDVGVTHAYHMGCYASLPAVRVAQGLVAASPNAEYRADIVHTEMCGLHMNANAHTPEQIVVQSLFADGHIKYTVSDSGSAYADGRAGFEVLAIREFVVPETEGDMSWSPEAWGLRMNLSREVPNKIREVIGPFFERLAADAGQDSEKLLKSHFAIHPGGPKIIQSVQELLNLDESQVSASKSILFERGNMSSATLPHVWKRLLESSSIHRGDLVVSFAFGPGLTVFGSVFRMC